jgi:hypothetical protein
VFRSSLRALLVVSVLGLTSACSLLDQASSPSLDVHITVKVRVVDDRGEGVAGADVASGKTSKGLTGPDGTLAVKLSGHAGRVVPLTVKCPAGFASPDKTIDVGITQLAPGSPAPLFEARCTALVHSLVVALRAENGPDLPVIYLGREVARTDAQGMAHIVLKLPPGETASLRLDTSGAPALLPRNPEFLFKAGNRDEMLLLDEKFTILRKRVIVHAASRPTPLP